MIVWRTTR